MRIALLVIFTTHCFYAADILKGDKDAAAEETFSFAIQGHTQTTIPDIFGQYVYTAARADQTGLSKDFALARVARDSDQFIPLAPEKVNLNPMKVTEKDEAGNERVVTRGGDVLNPAYNKGIAYIDFFDGKENILQGSQERLALVVADDLKTIYLLNQFNDKGENVVMLSAHNLTFTNPGFQSIPDAVGTAATSGIVALAAGSPNIFAAVKPAVGGSFGDTGSGIALIVVGSFSESNTGPTVLDAPTYNPRRTGGNRAAALDLSSGFLKITSDLASIGQVVDLYWNPFTARLYVALAGVAGAGGSDGVRAIAIGRFEVINVTVTDSDGKEKTEQRYNAFVLEEIAPTSVFDGALNKVVGAVGASAEVSIHKIRGMYSSTSLPYLIGVGGVGSSATTKRTVFALPLVVGNSDPSKNGTIANKNSTPESIYTGGSISNFITQAIPHQATTPSEMPLATDAAVQVGAGDLLNGDITDLFVFEDAVWVTVQDEDGNQIPGMFYSQALFDETGKIKAWTTWRREAGTVDHVLGIQFDKRTANKIFFSGDAADVRTVKRTRWADGADDGLKSLIEQIDATFPPSQGGEQGVFDFVVTSTSLNTSTPGLANISLLIVTGLKKIFLAETSRVESGIVIPNYGSDFGSLESFDNGTITKTFPVGANKMIAIEGGVLDTIGVITAAEVARDGDAGLNGWIFVGGVNGMAVLSQADGSGWDATTKLDPGFDGLVAGMSFKQVGEYTFVRKISNDGRYLYVLTDTQLDRIDLTVGNPGLGTISPVTLVRAEELLGSGGTFLDLIVSEKMALLATNNGLWRNEYDVQTAQSLSWQKVETPESVGCIRQLVAITPSIRAQNVSRDAAGGNVYALAGYRGKNQAQIFRYAIQSTSTQPLTDKTVQKISDLFVRDRQSYFASFGLFRNIVATDGSLFFGTRGKNLEDDPLVTALASNSTVGIQTGIFSRPLFNRVIDVGLSDKTIISAMLKLSSSGSWLVGTDNGIRVNE